LLEVFGLNERGVLGGKFDIETTVASLYMVALGLSFTHAGAMLAASRRRPARFDAPRSSQNLRVIGWAFLSVSAIPNVLLLWDGVQPALAGGYIALYQREISTGAAAAPQAIAAFMIPAALLLAAGADGRRIEKFVAAAIIAIHAAVELFLGYRSTALLPVLAFVWLWNRCEQRISPRWLFAAGVLLFAVVIPLSRESRALTGTDRVTIKALTETYLSIDNPAVSTVSEMGASMAAIAYTYVLVP